ncbi:hypothetical protein [Nocardia otitidiscaviarum]|uniref:hypothetical protein n=1 Tax=Nocardia otitidiscaviarum TaxID=1823 RepID=UPI002457C55F|nr:hypothetical protein [Nocardia otitidiscaviarum]
MSADSVEDAEQRMARALVRQADADAEVVAAQREVKDAHDALTAAVNDARNRLHQLTSEIDAD